MLHSVVLRASVTFAASQPASSLAHVEGKFISHKHGIHRGLRKVWSEQGINVINELKFPGNCHVLWGLK